MILQEGTTKIFPSRSTRVKSTVLHCIPPSSSIQSRPWISQAPPMQEFFPPSGCI